MNNAIIFRDAIIEKVQLEFPEISVNAHDGRFDLKSLEKLSVALPSIYIAVLGWSPLKNSIANQARADVDFVAYLVTENGQATSLENSALNIADQLACFINGNRFGIKGFPADRMPAAKNLYTGALNGQQVNLWSLHWKQNIKFGGSLAKKLGVDGDGLPFTNPQIAPVAEPETGSAGTGVVDNG